MSADDDIYRQLQRHLDRMPVPFPAAGSGVEIRILQQLFTPEEARLALSLSAIPETLPTIHRRLRHLTREQLGEALDRMAGKGSIRKIPIPGAPRYAKAPLVFGMYEAQVNHLTPQLHRDVQTYFDETFGRALHSLRTPQMRVVPIQRPVPVERTVASYDDIRAFVQASPGPFAALNCICRQGKDLVGEPCRQTHERQNCLLFGVAATAMIEKADARPVSREEMLALLDQADREGLVLEPQNTQDPLFVCCCCGCCCGVLTSAKKLPRPADYFQTDFIAAADSGTCQVCGMCSTRCAMDAITAPDGPPVIAEERCIGCGLCVSTCPSGALSLRAKEPARTPPPKDMRALYTTMFQDRYGRLGATAAVAGHLLGRKF